MNKSRKNLKILLCLAALCMLGGCTSNQYSGVGIPFLTTRNSDCILNVYDFKQENVYQRKLGNQSEVFWLTSTIYPEEVIAVDNNNVIYVFKEDEMKTFEEIVKNIIEIYKLKSRYIIIHADVNSSYIDLWNEDFSKRLHSIQLEGTYDCSYMNDSELYFSVYDDIGYQYSKIYSYSANSAELNVLYETDLAVSIYPFFFDNQLYAFFNKKITDIANIDIYKVYRITEEKEEEIMELENSVKKVMNYNGENYVLLGEHSTYVNKIDFIKGTDKKMYNINAEIPKGIFSDKDNLYVITDNAIYQCENNRLVTKIYMDSLLVNEFK